MTTPEEEEDGISGKDQGRDASNTPTNVEEADSMDDEILTAEPLAMEESSIDESLELEQVDVEDQSSQDRPNESKVGKKPKKSSKSMSKLAPPSVAPVTMSFDETTLPPQEESGPIPGARPVPTARPVPGARPVPTATGRPVSGAGPPSEAPTYTGILQEQPSQEDAEEQYSQDIPNESKLDKKPKKSSKSMSRLKETVPPSFAPVMMAMIPAVDESESVEETLLPPLEESGPNPGARPMPTARPIPGARPPSKAPSDKGANLSSKATTPNFPIDDSPDDETSSPSLLPSQMPTHLLSMEPTHQPSIAPTPPTETPVTIPSSQPIMQPSLQPTMQPSSQPTMQPSLQPTMQPSSQTTMQPSEQPTIKPSLQPSIQPSIAPTRVLTQAPSLVLTQLPTINETQQVVLIDEEAQVFYEFPPGEASEPTSEEIQRLEIATTAFYIGIFSEAYIDNPNTTVLTIVANVANVTYSANAVPPIQVEWEYEIYFDASSSVIPSSEELLDLIYGDEDTINSYVDLYLQNGDDLWSSVVGVTFEPDPNDETTLRPTASLTGGVDHGDFPITEVEATLLFSFMDEANMTAPSQDDYNRLESALSVYYTALLTQEYVASDDTDIATVVASVLAYSFTERSDNPVQANTAFAVLFSQDSTTIPSSENIFRIMQDYTDSLEVFIRQDFQWDDPIFWGQVSSVMIEPLSAIRQGSKGK